MKAKIDEVDNRVTLAIALSTWALSRTMVGPWHWFWFSLSVLWMVIYWITLILNWAEKRGR